MTLDDYLDDAKLALRTTSDRALGRALNVSPGCVVGWRNKRCWPSDEQMMKVAKLAGIDPRVAVLQLNMWRSKSPAATNIYEKILLTLSKAAAVVLIMTGVFTCHPNRTFAEQIITDAGAMYIMGNRFRRLKA